MELKRYIHFISRWLWLMVLLAIAGAAIAYVFSSQQTPVYASSARVLVNQARPGAANIPTIDDLRTRDRLAGTYANLLSRRPLLEEVIKNLQLTSSPAAIAASMRVTIVPNTEIIDLTVENTNPKLAADIANEIVSVFNKQAADLLENPYMGSREALNIVEPARPGSAPVSPDTNRNMLLAAIIGILLASGVGFLFNYFDDRVKSSREVEQLTGLAALVAIARIRKSTASEKLVTARDTHSPIAEGYRMFLGHINWNGNGNPVRTLVVTSGTPGEGKSTTAANLAVALAQTGKRVALVDTDLRLPTLHTFFNSKNERGVTTALVKKDGEYVRDHMIATGIENLLLMPSGPLPENPVKLLGAEGMAKLIEELKTQADIVVFDSPAMLAVVDAMLLVRSCDAALMVVQANVTRADALRRAVDQITQSGTRLLGVVLNCASTSQGSYLSYYGRGGRRKRYASWHRGLNLPFLRGRDQAVDTAKSEQQQAV